MAAVILSNVDKVYDGPTKVVDNLSLHIKDGEFIVLVGPSGCGKSTTLRMIAGLEEVTRGTIQIGERVVNDMSPKDRDIAMVFQSYALYPHMSVFDNMAFALKLRKLPRAEIEQKVRRAAEILGIQPLLERKPKALSGGQRQRVALGRAIVRDPQCFLFDEPLSNLDAKLRLEMRTEIREIHDQLEATTVYVTHDQEEAMTLGDRVVVMKDGVAQQIGSAADIYHLPKNRFVAGFLGSPSMNFLEGRLVREGQAIYFDEGSAKLRLSERAQRQLEGHVGEAVVLGVRPELLADREHARFATAENALDTSVRQVQMLGDCVHVYLATAAHPKLVASVDGHARLAPKERVPFHVDMERCLFFATSATGERLNDPLP
ncbi:MAG TPA: sn-glycerol-3-phosphate ABC transporter ATP-binding protein UgpC [Polyangiaceae bacterium]|nr:sn-glycerol-3-phosphate ABC transporter ATP-binding protein UgpC [Polyangiaceae bacterium]